VNRSRAGRIVDRLIVVLALVVLIAALVYLIGG
jgi:hypothetical protein